MSDFELDLQPNEEPGDNQPWLPIYADMMTLLFAFFVLLYSMSSPDPVKYAAFANSQATKIGGSTDKEMYQKL